MPNLVRSKGGGWVPADHPDAADPSGASASAPSTSAAPAGRSYVDHRTYAPPSGQERGAFFAGLNPGQTVEGQPGSTWQHDGQGWYWDSGAGAGGGTGGGTGGVATAGGPGTTATTPEDALANDAPVEGSTTTEGTQELFNDKLIEIIGQDPSNVSITDPTLAPQADTFAASQERARRARQEAMAERFGSQGLESSGAMDAEIASSFEDAGRNTSAFNAQLVGGELERRRAEIMQAMALAGNTLNADLTRDLQRELAEIDAAIRREGLSVQTLLGQGDLDVRRFGTTGNLNLGLLQLLMGDKHFGQELGFNIGAKEADLNSAALMALLFGR